MFVRRHGGLPIARLRAITGLPEDTIRALLREAEAPPPSAYPPPPMEETRT